MNCSDLLLHCLSLSLFAAWPSAVANGKSSAGSDVSVVINGSMAEVQGTARSLDEAERALAVIRGQFGATNLVNKVIVRGGTPDAVVRKQALEVLKNQRVLDGSRILVSVKNGKATLSGEIGSLDERDLARELVSRVDGISEIENRLEVMFDSIRTDEQIAAQIELMVSDDPGYEGSEIKAHVHEGIVRLSGEIGSRELWDLLVSKSYVTGVFAVEAHEVLIDPNNGTEEVAAVSP